jgi:hypothetical protein
MTSAPVGTNFVGVALAHSWGAILLDKTIPVDNLDGSIYSIAPSYTRYINLFGLTGRITATVPVATGEWTGVKLLSGTDSSLTRTGLGDAVANLTVFLIGARAMTPSEFRDYRRKTIIGFNLRVSIPTGQYDPTKLLNLGSNRWQFGPALALSQWFGKLSVEAYAAAWFFTDNAEAFGGNVVSQDPLYAFQLNVAYSFKPGLWLAAGARQTAGGETSVNGGSKGNPAEWTRLGLILGVPLGGRHVLKLVGTTGVRNTTGADFNTVAAQWVYGF